MGRTKEFDHNDFTIYDISRRMRMSYAFARKFVSNLLENSMIERVTTEGKDGRSRRYKIL